ncbi:MAG: cell division protein FtsA [Deltaproteobacteria bacterium CG23_combo_of_CG06-09_8_20_14_all_60_8]|nr:MAG: cell division protein FtsA [Desulfobacterales bacterium CG2_30_60_27]PIP43096.1 MAG: cell division protein FtsA [Deltaproteobacteria bacterium CG23_combo_of_CG06-09_8_20_14_all_60_8]
MAQSSRGDLVVGLDIGTTKICVVVGEVHANAEVDIIGIGLSPSNGLRKGVVVNIESTVQSIKKAIDEAERMAGCQISSVYVGIAGSHIKGFNSRGQVPIRCREITQADIDRVVDAARAVNIPPDQEIIHVLPQEFIVDEQEGIQYPLGMTGVRLEADVHIVTGAVTPVRNIVKCCNLAGLEVSDVVLEPLASSCAVLTREEMELGIGLLDIGGGTSDLAIFVDGTIKHTFVLGLGGHNLTNDLSIGLRTPLKEAERLKEEFGCALVSMIDKDQTIEVPSVGGRKARKMSRKVMGEILEPRVEEMLTLINQELGDSHFKSLINAGMVITGGTALLANMTELAEQIFDLPVRIGFPQQIGGITDLITTPQCSTGVGLVVYGMKNEPQHQFRGKDEGMLGRIAGRMRDWFKKVT